jgi:lipoprotein-anchoring transpeptidase ErfK/SrfK
MEGTRVSGRGVCLGGERLWQLAILAAGTLGVSWQAEAAIYYWQDSAPIVTQAVPKAPARRTKGQRHGDKKSGAIVEKESKPQGPLIISISIVQQKLRLYDANGLFAESPVSTGMPGHPTPMGVFSVIQKQKFHRSNIYSGAPMPFMQRITWSGVAMHAGVLPGHPASHGCIRMPAAFAVKMYGWTKMGARVIITPGDVTPASFSHPLLATLKVVPQPVSAEETKADVIAVQGPKEAALVEANKLTTATEAKLELRSSVGHVETIKSADDEIRPSTALKTADASGALPAALTTTDAAAPGASPAKSPEVTSSGREEASRAAVESTAPKLEIDPGAAKRDAAAASAEKSVSEKSAEAETAKTVNGDAKPVEVASDPSPRLDPFLPTREAAKAGDAVGESSSKASPAQAPQTNEQADIPSQKPAPTTAPAATPSSAAAPIDQPVSPAATGETPLKNDLKSDFAKTASKIDPGFAFQGTGQIAVFVSRKDSKLYIRQDFAPLFQTPVTIAADPRPLGTHIFTARVDGSDHNVLHWSVVSLPSPAKAAERPTEQARNSRGHKFANTRPIEANPQPAPDSPAEALDRLSVPAEVMAKIYEAVSTGGSIIVSDQGIAAGETGEGTDFIVSLRQ